MRWTITSGRLPRGAEARPLPATRQGVQFPRTRDGLAFVACGGGTLKAHTARGRHHGQRAPPLQADDRHVTEEKEESSADIEEEELHRHLQRDLLQSLVGAAFGGGLRARDPRHEIRMEGASSIGESEYEILWLQGDSATVGGKWRLQAC